MVQEPEAAPAGEPGPERWRPPAGAARRRFTLKCAGWMLGCVAAAGLIFFLQSRPVFGLTGEPGRMDVAECPYEADERPYCTGTFVPDDRSRAPVPGLTVYMKGERAERVPVRLVGDDVHGTDTAARLGALGLPLAVLALAAPVPWWTAVILTGRLRTFRGFGLAAALPTGALLLAALICVLAAEG